MENEEQKQTSKSSTMVFDLLKQLAELQATNAKLSAKIFMEQGREKITGKVSSTRELILSKARMYGQKIDKVVEQYNLNSREKNSILGEYQKILEDINKSYEDPLKNATVELNGYEEMEAEYLDYQAYYKDRLDDIKSSNGYKEYYQNEYLNSDEYKRYKEDEEDYNSQYKEYEEMQERLKKEIDMANEKGDMETVRRKAEERQSIKAPEKPIAPPPEENYEPANFYYTKMESVRKEVEDLREIIEICKKEYDKISDARDTEIENVEVEKDNKMLEVAKKQTPFQKIAFAVLNRINGAKKFKDNVMDNINLGIEDFKVEKLPKIEQTVFAKAVEFSIDMADRREKFKKNLQENREFISETLKNARGRIKDSATNVRNFAVNSAEKVGEGIIDAKDAVVDRVKATGEKIVEAKDTVSDGIVRVGEEISNKVKTTKESIEKKVINRGRQTFNDIVMKGRDVKINTLQKINDTIQASIDKNIEKNNQLRSRIKPEEAQI